MVEKRAKKFSMVGISMCKMPPPSVGRQSQVERASLADAVLFNLTHTRARATCSRKSLCSTLINAKPLTIRQPYRSGVQAKRHSRLAAGEYAIGKQQQLRRAQHKRERDICIQRALSQLYRR